MAEATTLTLTEFLLARIAEDKASARQIPTAFEWSKGGREWTRVQRHEDMPTNMLILSRVSETAPDPRVLADCNAKRRVIEEANLHGRQNQCYIAWGEGQDCEVADVFMAEMAALYADHPDYREEWRP